MAQLGIVQARNATDLCACIEEKDREFRRADEWKIKLSKKELFKR